MRRQSQFPAALRHSGCERLMLKSGKCNVTCTNLRRRKRRYMADLFTTLVDLKWRYCLLAFFAAFFSSWLVFSLGWWTVSRAHGDHDSPRPLGFEPCLHNVNSFVATLLFSMETQITIGYGSRYPSDRCPTAVLLVTLQSYANLILQTLMTGVVLAKLTRSKHRAATLQFSQCATVCSRGGQRVLQCRVGDTRRSHLIDCSVRGMLVTCQDSRAGDGGKTLEQRPLNLSLAGGDHRLFLGWPLTVEHRIDFESPLWRLSEADLCGAAEFELLVFLNGVVVSTGAAAEARTSYLPSEIRWGHEFEELRILHGKDGGCLVDCGAFHGIRGIPGFPHCSAAEVVGMSCQSQ